jgi:hypothetical protein
LSVERGGDLEKMRMGGGKEKERRTLLDDGRKGGLGSVALDEAEAEELLP